MARKKTSKKKSTKRDPERAQRNKRIAIGSAVLIGGTGVFVGAAMGVGELDRRAAGLIVAADPVVLIDWPTDSAGRIWMPLKDRADIERLLARSVQGGSALSNSALKEASLALKATGWIDSTPTARWTSDGKIDLQASWRIPVAAVRIGTREIIIDRDRHALPLDYPINESNQIYFINTDAPLPKIGQQWAGTNLQDGIALFELLNSEGLLEQVAGFDLGAEEFMGTIRIITRRGAKITWGAGPGRVRPGEVPTSVKLARLHAFYDKSGLIDAGHGYIEIHGSDIEVQRAED